MVSHVFIWKWMETQIILQKPYENVSIEYSVEYQSAGKAFCLCGLLAQFCSTAWFNQFTACRSLPECTCWAFPTLVTFYMCTPLSLLRSISYHLIWPNSRSISGSSRNGRIPTLLNLKGCWSHTKLPIFPEVFGFSKPCHLLASQYIMGCPKASVTSPSFRFYHSEN